MTRKNAGFLIREVNMHEGHRHEPRDVRRYDDVSVRKLPMDPSTSNGRCRWKAVESTGLNTHLSLLKRWVAMRKNMGVFVVDAYTVWSVSVKNAVRVCGLFSMREFGGSVRMGLGRPRTQDGQHCYSVLWCREKTDLSQRRKVLFHRKRRAQCTFFLVCFFFHDTDVSSLFHQRQVTQ